MTNFLKALAIAGIVSLTAFAPTAQALNIELDFSGDSENFFTGHQDRIDSLNRAVTYVNSFIGTTQLAALNSGTVNGMITQYDLPFIQPVSGITVANTQASVAANTAKIFVGSWDMNPIGSTSGDYQFGLGLGSNQRATGVTFGPGSTGPTTVAAQLLADSRGTTNYAETKYIADGTNGLFMPAISTIEFNSNNTNAFYFGAAAPSVAQAGLYDFQTVAVRTILDAISNFSTGASLGGSKFTTNGAISTAAGVQLDLAKTNWMDGNVSTTIETGLVSKMLIGTTLNTGERLALTTMDAALLNDTGWTVINPANVSPVPEPSTYAAFAGAFCLGFVAWSRRKV
jgi:hypothetical protein